MLGLLLTSCLALEETTSDVVETIYRIVEQGAEDISSPQVNPDGENSEKTEEIIYRPAPYHKGLFDEDIVWKGVINTTPIGAKGEP